MRIWRCGSHNGSLTISIFSTFWKYVLTLRGEMWYEKKLFPQSTFCKYGKMVIVMDSPFYCLLCCISVNLVHSICVSAYHTFYPFKYLTRFKPSFLRKCIRPINQNTDKVCNIKSHLQNTGCLNKMLTTFLVANSYNIPK